MRSDVKNLCYEVMEAVRLECEEYGVSGSVTQAIVQAAKSPFRSFKPRLPESVEWALNSGDGSYRP